MGLVPASSRRQMNKAAYATVFLALCAIVLLVHVNVSQEETREASSQAAADDTFIANLEAHVVAKAQRRLRQHEARMQQHKNIKQARSTIKAMLMDAATSAQQDVSQEEQQDRVVAQTKTGAKKVQPKTKFTWAELQEGADVKPKKQQKHKVTSLLANLKKAPKLKAEAPVKKPNLDSMFGDDE